VVAVPRHPVMGVRPVWVGVGCAAWFFRDEDTGHHWGDTVLGGGVLAWTAAGVSDGGCDARWLSGSRRPTWARSAAMVRSRKNLAQNPNCVLTTGCNGLDDGLDLVVEGAAAKVAQPWPGGWSRPAFPGGSVRLSPARATRWPCRVGPRGRTAWPRSRPLQPDAPPPHRSRRSCRSP
jgi:hypothetical protein